MHALSSFLDVLLGLSADKADQLTVFQVCMRAVVVYLALIGYVRFAKKRFLGEATGFDAILVIVIGSIASRGISGTAPFVPSLAGTLTLVVFQWLVSCATESRPGLSFLVKGHDTILIRNGRIDHRALKAAHMSRDDLDEDLRQQGVENPRKVKEARLERSGKLSVIRK